MKHITIYASDIKDIDIRESWLMLLVNVMSIQQLILNHTTKSEVTEHSINTAPVQFTTYQRR